MDQSTRRRAYKLRFPELGDLQVRVRMPSYRGLRLLARAVKTLGGDLRGEHLTSEMRLEAWGVLFDAFASALIDWNVTDQGVAVPATRAGVYDQDVDLLLLVAKAWYHRVALRLGREQLESKPAPAEQAEPASAVRAEPSPEELALVRIPVEIGNDALEDDDAGDDAGSDEAAS